MTSFDQRDCPNTVVSSYYRSISIFNHNPLSGSLFKSNLRQNDRSNSLLTDGLRNYAQTFRREWKWLWTERGLGRLYGRAKREYDSLNSFLQAFEKNIFWLPVQKICISGLTITPITSGKVRICRHIFDMFLRMFQTICRPIFSDFEPGELFSTLVTHIRGSMSHMSHSDIIYLTDQ